MRNAGDFWLTSLLSISPMLPKSIPEPWKSFLSEVDDSLNEEVEMHCLECFVCQLAAMFFTLRLL